MGVTFASVGNASAARMCRLLLKSSRNRGFSDGRASLSTEPAVNSSIRYNPCHSAPVTFGVGATPADVPRWMDDIGDTGLRGYVAAGDKILETTDGINLKKSAF